ncbi:hypothetical protein XENORESO_019274 [Xenotaenia resolanae]|uniref:Uncharacterized protein n=1 Tax=Xenotaenia resolanae TaxID=208358 RepID=A0ABV0X9B6_9TELE
MIKVKCGPPLHLNGPDTNYIVQLLNVSGSKQNKKSCDFEFKDLSYLTSYTVEVVIFNGRFNSTPVTYSAVTNYNKKGLIIGLVTLIIFISCVALGVSFFIRKRREFRNVGNEELMLNPTAIYTNMPPPKGNHKALR